MSPAGWQRQLRKQFGLEQPISLQALGPGPLFGDYRVTNPGNRSSSSVGAARGPLTGSATSRHSASCGCTTANNDLKLPLPDPGVVRTLAEQLLRMMKPGR